LPSEQGGVVIVSNAGGPAIISVDSCSKYGLKMADIDSSKEAISKIIPPHGSARNPVDIVGDADFKRFEKVLVEVISNPNVGSIVTMCTPSATLNYDDLARTIVKTSKGSGKTMLAALMGLAEGIQNKEILSEGGIPHFTYAESAIHTLEAMYRFRDWIRVPGGRIRKFDADKKRVREVLDNVRKSDRRNLVEEEGYEVLEAYGFTTPKTILANSAEQSVNASHSIGYPVVMKIASPDIIHKSDAAGVKVGLANDEHVRMAFNAIIQNAKRYKPDANIKGIIVQEMVKSGKEIILGAKQDPIFGPLVMFGLGGIYVEVLKDVVFRLAPIDEHEANRMVHSIKGFKLLKGVRGESPSDIRALVDSLLRISQLVTEFPEITEFDMNPLMVLGEGNGVRAVDVRISLKS